jgi:NAD(P)-dependent dehydrogenase (short-subunit alcohol dehydrogenase family)
MLLGQLKIAITNETVFGPVLSLFPFKDEGDAIEFANSTDHGLAAFVHLRRKAMADLDGKVAIVTGGGGGIGRGEALRMAADGAAVVVNDSNKDAAEETSATIRERGGRAVAFVGDVSRWETGQGMVELALNKFGRLDVLINNAGNSRPKMIVNMSEEDWDSVTLIHLKGSFVGTKYAAIHWREQSKQTGAPVVASIIMTTSGNGLHGQPGYINYVAAKGGIASMTTTLARELAPYGVRVNAIAPLAFSGMTAPLWGGDLFSDERRDELSPDNVAQVVGWLASPRSAPITGQIVSFGGRRISISQEWPTIGSAETEDGLWSYEVMDRVRGQLFENTKSAAG